MFVPTPEIRRLASTRLASPLGREYSGYVERQSSIILLEPVEAVPFGFSLVAPGYFLPSGSWLSRGDKRVLGTYAPEPRLVEWNGRSLIAWLDEFEKLLGEVFKDIVQTFERGQRSPSPPRTQHRLAHLLSLTVPSLSFYRIDEVPYIDPLLVAELYAHLAVWRRASKEPVWRDELRPAVKDPQAYLHDLILFMSLEMLERVFGTVGPLMSTASASREPDLHFMVEGHRVRLEVKVPETLVLYDAPGPEPANSAKFDADRIIGNAIGASVGTHGQIRPDRPGVVIVGGFKLVPQETQALEKAASAYLARNGAKYPYLLGAGVHFMGFGRGVNLYGAGRVMPGFHIMPNTHAVGPVRVTAMSRIETTTRSQSGPESFVTPPRAAFHLQPRYLTTE